MDTLLVVTEPVVNIRRKPIKAQPAYIHDDLQETQALYNEILRYKDESNDWFYVEAVEQKKWGEKGLWQGYPGWVKKESVRFVEKYPEYTCVVRDAVARISEHPSMETKTLLIVSIGTRLRVFGMPENGYEPVYLDHGETGWIAASAIEKNGRIPDTVTLKENIINTAGLFLDVPYLWGGRSMYMPELLEGKRESGERRAESKKFRSLNSELQTSQGIATGVDCSGLVNLVFRANRIDIPRDACDQWREAEKIPLENIEPCDLIFLSAEEKPDSITHVMLYAGGEEFIEAAETGGTVRINTFREKFGMSRSELIQNHLAIGSRTMYFGKVTLNR